MKNVIEALKNEIEIQNQIIRGIRGKINGLKWRAGGQEAHTKVRAERSLIHGTSYPASGKADLAEFRRPETGPERYVLWNEKRAAGSEARYLLLAYGALRGRSYPQIEPKCREGNEPSVYRIWDAIPDHVYAEISSWWTEKAIEAWLKGTPLPLPPRPERKPVVAPVMMEASL